MVDFRPDMDHVQIWTTKEPIVPQRAPNAENSIDAGPDHLDPRRFDPTNRRRLSAPGLRTFLAIAALWGLTEEERRRILGGPSRSTYQNWVKTVREHHEITLGADVLTRISAVLGIHQALGILFDG